MVDIFDEVSDDLRHDQAVRLAKRYGLYLLAAAVAVLVGVAVQQAYLAWQAKQADAAATKYLNLTASVDTPGVQPAAEAARQAGKALNEFAATAPEGYKTMANLRAAGLFAGAGELPQAEALWTGVAQDENADPLLRGLASLLWAQHALGTAPDADVLAQLQPLAQDASPFHALARETQALVYLHEGKTAMAKGLFAQIAADPAASGPMRARAQAMFSQLNG